MCASREHHALQAGSLSPAACGTYPPVVLKPARAVQSDATGAQLSGHARELYEDLQLMPLLRRLMLISCGLTEAMGGSISLVNHPAQQYTKIAERGTACRLGQSFPVDEGVTGKVMASRRPVVLRSYRDVADGHLAVDHPARDGAVAAIPIWWRGHVIGVNVVFAGCSRPFSSAEVDQLEVLTQLVAPGVVVAGTRDLAPGYLSDPAAGPHIPRQRAVSASVAEAARELAELGERAGVYDSRPGELLQVAVVREGAELHLLTPGPADPIGGGLDPLPLTDWYELVDSGEGPVAVRSSAGGGEAAVPARVTTAIRGPVIEPSPFSPREQQVAALLARGLSDSSLARELFISKKTVEKHVGAVLRKTGSTSRTGAVMRALEQGWLDGAGCRRVPEQPQPRACPSASGHHG